MRTVICRVSARAVTILSPDMAKKLRVARRQCSGELRAVRHRDIGSRNQGAGGCIVGYCRVCRGSVIAVGVGGGGGVTA